MWSFKKSKKLRRNKSYYYMLVQKAVPLSRKWYFIMQGCNDPKRVRRIHRHILRIAAIQSAAMAKTN